MFLHECLEHAELNIGAQEPGGVVLFQVGQNLRRLLIVTATRRFVYVDACDFTVERCFSLLWSRVCLGSEFI